MTHRWVSPRPQPDRIWVGANQAITNGNGTPAIGATGTGANAGRYTSWLLDAAASEGVVAVAGILPVHWVTWNADLWWSNAGAGAGNVVWRADRAVIADGAATPNFTSNQLAAVAAPVQNTIKVTVDVFGAAAVAAPTAGQLLLVGADRLGADVNDTLANDASLVGLLLRRVA